MQTLRLMKNTTESIISTLKALPFLFACTLSYADDTQWALCSPWALPEMTTSDLSSPTLETLTSGATHMSADDLVAPDDSSVTLTGNVYIKRDHDQMLADHAHFITYPEQLTVSGRLHYQTLDSLIYADSAAFSPSSETARFSKANYFFEQNHINGYSELLEKEGDQVTTLIKTSYTSCDPNDIDWQFKASEIRLDQDKGFGTAKHTRLYFKKVPIFYFPILTFPIDDRRKSGFLIPEIGRSSNRGTEVMLPYYWNIAPQADATLALHNMTKRGLQTASEWRYLSKNTFNQLHYEYLDDQFKQEERTLLQFDHSSTLPFQWKSSINYIDLSDPEYYIDGLSNDLSGGRKDTLQSFRIANVVRQASLQRASEHWTINALTQDFVIIDDSLDADSKPYTLLPKLLLESNYDDLPGHLDFGVHAELTRFTHKTKNDTDRFDIYPKISRTFGSSGWFISPKLGIRHTQYSIENNTENRIDQYSRTLPIISIDSGLILERTSGQSKQLLQTLEPRVFYLKVPYRDQNQIPLYDTRALNFSYAQLFRDNQYIGPDRVQDANQATLALSSRILQKSSGDELFRASIGRIFYAEDRQVTIDSDKLQTQAHSNIIMETSAVLNKRWTSKLNLEWNSENQQLEKGSTSLRYKQDNNHIINFGYQFRRDILEQAEVVWRWPLSRQWTTVAKWQYSLHEQFDANNSPLIEQHDIETFFGLEYESCCYVFRAIGRRYLKPIMSEPNITDQYDTEIFLQFSFKGFSQFGDNANDLLLHNIIGYEEQY